MPEGKRAGLEPALRKLFRENAESMPTLYSRPNDSPRSSSRRFVIIFTSIHSLRNPEKLEYWMKKIMRNLALQYLNHANANPTIPLTDIPEEEEPAENPFVRISFRTIRCWI